MISLFFVILLANSCPKTKIINITDLPWDKEDSRVLLYAKKRCAQLYTESPCLKFFKKYDFQAYTAICGPIPSK